MKKIEIVTDEHRHHLYIATPISGSIPRNCWNFILNSETLSYKQ